MTKKRQILFSVIRGLLAILIALLVATLLIFLSAEDHLVSKPEQVRFVVKLARRGLTSETMIIVPGTKHEIYGSGSRILRGYWKRIFAFLEEPQVEKDGSGK